MIKVIESFVARNGVPRYDGTAYENAVASVCHAKDFEKYSAGLLSATGTNSVAAINATRIAIQIIALRISFSFLFKIGSATPTFIPDDAPDPLPVDVSLRGLSRSDIADNRDEEVRRIEPLLEVESLEGDEFEEVTDRLESGQNPEEVEESMPDLGANDLSDITP